MKNGVIYIYIILISSFLIDLCSNTLITHSSCPSAAIKNGKARRRQRGRFVKFVCNTGYMMAGEKYSICVSGKWEPTPPVCVRPTCMNRVNPPANGLIYPTHSGAALHIYCKPGYTLRGPTDVYCDGRQWDNNMPSCLPTDSKPKLFCDFEDEGICDWSHDLNHDFDWRRENFKTPSGSIGTGPSFDHTKGIGNDGHYMYIESSSRYENDSARLISPIFDKTGNEVCLEFFYHMYGATTGTLRVYVKKLSESWKLDPKKAIFSKSGNQGNRWYRSYHSLGIADEDYQIVIEGIRGNGYVSDIAIDDVKVIEDCVYEEITTTTEVYGSTELIPTVESCENRCGHKAIGNETNQIICDCDDSCYDNNKCCPDYFDFCVAGTTEDDVSTTEMSNEVIVTTLGVAHTTTSVPRSATTKNLATTIQILKSTSYAAVPPTTTRTTTTATTTTKPTTRSTARKVTVKTTTSPKPTKKIQIITRPTVKLLPVPTQPVIVKKTNPPTDKNNTKTIDVKPKKTDTKNKENDVMDLPKPTKVDDELWLLTSPIPKVNIKENWVPQEIEDKFNSPLLGNHSENDKLFIVKASTSAGYNGLLVVISVLGVTILTTVISVVLIRRYRGRHRRMASSNGDSQSDVRYLTSDEVLNFSLDKDYDSL